MILEHTLSRHAKVVWGGVAVVMLVAGIVVALVR